MTKSPRATAKTDAQMKLASYQLHQSWYLGQTKYMFIRLPYFTCHLCSYHYLISQLFSRRHILQQLWLVSQVTAQQQLTLLFTSNRCRSRRLALLLTQNEVLFMVCNHADNKC